MEYIIQYNFNGRVYYLVQFEYMKGEFWSAITPSASSKYILKFPLRVVNLVVDILRVEQKHRSDEEDGLAVIRALPADYINSEAVPQWIVAHSTSTSEGVCFISSWPDDNSYDTSTIVAEAEVCTAWEAVRRFDILVRAGYNSSILLKEKYISSPF